MIVPTPPLQSVLKDGVMTGASGGLFTVKVVIDGQPAAKYVIIDVPRATPVTVPEASIVATPVLLLVQVPPDVASLRVVVPPVHVTTEPAIGSGSGFTTMLIAPEEAVEPVTQPLELVITQ